MRAKRAANAVQVSLMAGILALVSVLVACEEPKDIGLPPTTAIGVLYTDTLTVKTSTIQLDSVENDRNLRLFVGNYSDPVFGKVSAKAFGQLYVEAGSFKTEGEMVYDSLLAWVGYSYVYGDTTKVQDIFIHRLTQDLDTTKRYTSNSSATYEAQPLVKIQLTPSALGGSKSVRMPDALGRELLDLSKGSGVTQVDFEKKFKGIALVPGANNTTVFGFSNGVVYLELYYHNSTDTTKRYATDFSMSRARPSFSQIKVDRSGTKLAGLSLNKSLSASETGGDMFVQGATGVTTRVLFPTLENLKKETGRIAINRAELQFFVKGSSPGGPIPAVMTMAETDENNRVSYSVEAGTGNKIYHLLQTQAGTYQTANKWYYPQAVGYNTRQKTYAFDVTTYIQALLTGFHPNKGLVMFPTLTPSLVQQNPTTGAGVFLAQPYVFNQLNGAVLNGPVNVKLVVFYTYTP
ncbi:hypothetical protein GCM10028803_56820 [Larkinella knui]|uniref:DUF4270 family protein n=1 Tax=Larkinella knui TaxID=2025310 RepID=UPI0016394FDA|nr:DUF4270 family protein [Larkinella knui]